MTKELVPVDEQKNLAITPQEQVNEAAEMAKVLQGVVDQGDLALKLGPNKYLKFEAWQTIGAFFNISIVTEWTRPIVDREQDPATGAIIGWEAKVRLVGPDGNIKGVGESMCAYDEPNWKGKPSYALRSMAQTRAAGKALRSNYAWIAVMAGYNPTPAEEIPPDDKQEIYKQKAKEKAVTKNTTKAKDKEMSKAQAKFIMDLGKARDWPEERVVEMVRWKAEKEGIDNPKSWKVVKFFLGGKDENPEEVFDNTVAEFIEAKASEAEQQEDIPFSE